MRIRNLLLAGLGVYLPSLAVGVAADASDYRNWIATFEIKAQPIASALSQFGQQSGIQVLYYSDAAYGIKEVTDLAGTFSLDVALQKLLSQTGLTYSYVNERTVAIHAEEGSYTSVGEKIKLAQSDPIRSTASRALRVAQQVSSAVEPEEKKKNPQRIEEIVVTAQKREEHLQNVPISVSVLSGDGLDRSSVEGVSEALNAVPGVATQQNYLGGGTIVVVRGVGPGLPTLSGSSPVAYYLDSVPFGFVKSALAPDSNAYDLGRVEVLRGPQGTLYGASALNGVVRVLTKDANLNEFEFKARTSVSATQGGGENHRGDFAANVPIMTGKLAARAVIGYQDLSGWIDKPNREDANSGEIRNMRLKVNAQPTEQLMLSLTAWSSRSDFTAPSVGYAFDESLSALDEPLSSDYDAYGATITYQFSGISLSSSTSYLDYSNKGVLGLDVPFFNIPGSIFFAGENSRVFSEEIYLNSSRGGAWRWSVGGMFRRATQARPSYFTVIPVPATDAEYVSRSYAAFGELTRVFLQDRLELTVGLRHFRDEISQREQIGVGTPFIPAESTANADTPRGILTWHLTDHQMVYASFSEGFRSGFPQSASVPADAGIPAATPDRLRNYELGSKGSFMGGRVAYDASLYYIDWRDIQQSLGVFSPIYNLYIPATVNSQSASGVGLDLGLSVQPVQDLTLTASLGWNSLEMDSDVLSGGQVLFQKGDRPNSSPETTAAASAEYSFALGGQGYRGRLAASANYTSAQAYRGLGSGALIVQNGDSMFFTRASISVDSPERWTFTLYGDNLNGERGAPVRVFVGVPNWDARVRPRTVGLQLEYHFE